MRVALPLAALLAACGSSNGPAGPFDHLEVLATDIGPLPVDSWVADTPQARAKGLMDATDADLAPAADGTEKGMLFVFPVSSVVSFWMKDTEVALDLAYLADDGTILEVFALTPLDETFVPSSQPVRYALELRQGALAANGLGVGDVVALP